MRGHRVSWPFFTIMPLSKDALDREIQQLSAIITEVELAMALTATDPRFKNGLKSALGQLRAARTWLARMRKDLD